MPFGAEVFSVAVLPSASQMYVPSSHVVSVRFQRMRVSTSAPSNLNSFQSFVSTGNF